MTKKYIYKYMQLISMEDLPYVGISYFLRFFKLDIHIFLVKYPNFILIWKEEELKLKRGGSNINIRIS